jgi:redox-sensitive bicupin YhaK (pirin superfamily)
MKQMMVQTKAKIFLADERGLNETAWFRSWNTFNFGKYQQEHKKPFGDMYVLNDDTLEGGRSLSMLSEEKSYVILLPVIGAIGYKDSLGNESLIAAGQLHLIALDKGVTIQIINPFKEEMVNFLQLWIKADATTQTVHPYLSTYDVNEFANDLVEVSPKSIGELDLPFSISIGKFSGRGETIYQSKNNNTGLFVFVIEGAFEVEGRLLHARDGLALQDIEQVEMEALSNDAILLIIELPAIFSEP